MGVPHLKLGGYPISSREYPIPGLDGGGLVPGVPPLSRSGWWRVPRVTPDQVWMVGGYPDQVWMGYPPPIRQSSIASTCYAVGGVPLAFTQEDFLVY